jgi:6,7-dimethyl-8-ribityllumazine synthase
MNDGHSNQRSDHDRRIAFVQSCWHKDLVDQSRTTFIAEIGQLGIAESQIDFRIESAD